ncbi:MAG: DNA polymerase Y family protein [Rhizobacter sp.]|nr:DNA polymerase Y family protein [Ferruginibacter sp.]
MNRRFVSIWFRYLKTDWFIRRQPALKYQAFVLSASQRGRMVVIAANAHALQQGVFIGMAVADARAIIPSLQVLDDKPGLSNKLLTGIAGWCIRFTPAVATDAPDGLMLDVTGCAHLWGSEKAYLADICKRLQEFGYSIHIAIADTIGAAWAIARFGNTMAIVEPGRQLEAIRLLPPAALRIEDETTGKLQRAGLCTIGHFIKMPASALHRRFGPLLLQRLQQATGQEQEWIQPVQPLEPYQERLPCIEPIVTAKGIEIALEQLLNSVCKRLQNEHKGLRAASFFCYRVDGKIECLTIGTSRASCNTLHLFKLFQVDIDTLEPALGIELFTLHASKVEDLHIQQQKLWQEEAGLNDNGLYQLLDRIQGKIKNAAIHRYLPAEHYWPERSYQQAAALDQNIIAGWKLPRPRPLQLLPNPEPIEVTAPIPDYPPMLFRYKGTLHKIVKADGPERIEQEWWLQQGKHRDYYVVENEQGNRYWLFRLGHYDAVKTYQWFLHGFFA